MTRGYSSAEQVNVGHILPPISLSKAPVSLTFSFCDSRANICPGDGSIKSQQIHYRPPRPGGVAGNTDLCQDTRVYLRTYRYILRHTLRSSRASHGFLRESWALSCVIDIIAASAIALWPSRRRDAALGQSLPEGIEVTRISVNSDANQRSSQSQYRFDRRGRPFIHRGQADHDQK
jgi:hypothetical protein